MAILIEPCSDVLVLVKTNHACKPDMMERNAQRGDARSLQGLRRKPVRFDANIHVMSSLLHITTLSSGQKCY